MVLVVDIDVVASAVVVGMDVGSGFIRISRGCCRDGTELLFLNLLA